MEKLESLCFIYLCTYILNREIVISMSKTFISMSRNPFHVSISLLLTNYKNFTRDFANSNIRKVLPCISDNLEKDST